MICNKHLTNKVIVTLAECCNTAEKRNQLAKECHCCNAELLMHPEDDSAYSGDICVFEIPNDTFGNVERTIDKLNQNPNVLDCEPDYIWEFNRTPNDPLFPQLWGMRMINAPVAWNRTQGSNRVLVGVTDSGIDWQHPDLRGNMHSTGLNFANSNRSPIDLVGHGTHVAGTIGAIGNNGRGLAGVCWNINLVNLKLGDRSFDTAAAIRAINFAQANSIPILNNSWGGRANSAALQRAIANYRGLFVAAAGNNGTNNDRTPLFPASYNLPNVISVASVNSNGRLSSFSNFGSRTVHIAAPGMHILSTHIQNRYTMMSGTSMAAPHVTGVAALLLSSNSRLTTQQLRDIILSTATKTPTLNGLVSSGGILNAGAALLRV